VIIGILIWQTRRDFMVVYLKRFTLVQVCVAEVY